MKNTGDFEDLPAFLRDFETRLERQERHTHLMPPTAPVLPTFPPVVVEPEPEPEPTCITFTDDFERADGGLGANWMLAPETSYYNWVEVPMSIDGGEVIAPNEATGGADDAFGSAQWVAETPGDQFMEVCVTGLEYWMTYPTGQQMRGQVRLLCQAETATSAREELWFEWSDSRFLVGGGYRLNSYTVLADGSYGDDAIPSTVAAWPPALSDPTACIRFEVDMDGAHRIYLDTGTTGATTLVASGTSTSGRIGPHVGFRMLWFYALPGSTGVSPRILWAKGGCRS